MKKLIVYFTMLCLFISIAFAASVSRDMSSRVDPGSKLDVNLRISSIQTSDKVKTFVIEEQIPLGWKINNDWSISGIEESKDNVKKEFSGNTYKWEFTPTGDVTITYNIDLPATLGSYDFKATWFDLSGMSGADDGKSTLTVRTITCGDGVCEGDENSDNCEQDCPKPAPTVTEEIPPEIKEKKIPIGLVIATVIIVIGLIIYFSVIKKKKT